MTWKIKALIGVTVALAAGVVAQVAVYNSQPTTITMPASWAFHPQSLQEARNRAQSIVLAGVVAVQRGDDIVKIGRALV